MSKEKKHSLQPYFDILSTVPYRNEGKRFESLEEIVDLRVGRLVVFMGEKDPNSDFMKSSFQKARLVKNELYEIAELPGKDEDGMPTYFAIIDGNGEKQCFGWSYFGKLKSRRIG